MPPFPLHFIHCCLPLPHPIPSIWQVVGLAILKNQASTLKFNVWIIHLDSGIWGSFCWPPKIDNTEQMLARRQALASKSKQFWKQVPILKELFPKLRSDRLPGGKSALLGRATCISMQNYFEGFFLPSSVGRTLVIIIKIWYLPDPFKQIIWKK